MKEWVKSLGLAFCLFLLIRTFLVQAFKIPTGSMESTLLVGDFLLVNKLAYGATIPHRLPWVGVELPELSIPGYESPQRGDIVVFEYPFDRSLDYVKRCIAVPGDTVEMRDKVLYINGVPQDEPYAQYLDPRIYHAGEDTFFAGNFSWQFDYLTGKANYRGGEYRPTRDNFGPLAVPENKYFCMGDNRDHSSDSRYWGFVDRKLIEGSPMILYFSWDSSQLFPRFNRIGHLLH